MRWRQRQCRLFELRSTMKQIEFRDGEEVKSDGATNDPIHEDEDGVEVSPSPPAAWGFPVHRRCTLGMGVLVME
jgi:hypothetical protein